MITRYFVFRKDQIDETRALLVPDSDMLPLSEFRNIHPLHTFPDGSVLAAVGLESNVVQDIAEHTTTVDPLSEESVEKLDIMSSYVGRDRADIISRFQELAASLVLPTPLT